MSIRQMIPVGGFLRKCPVCGYPITAKSDALTVHELKCLEVPMNPVQRSQPSSEHTPEQIAHAVEIISMCSPIREIQGGMWFSHNHEFADATFVDYGACRAFAVAARSLASHVARIEALENALQELFDQPTENPLRMTVEQREKLWAAHAKVRALLQRTDR